MSRPYVFREYPKVKYHPAHGSRTVADPDEEMALGEEWGDRPHPKPDIPNAPSPAHVPGDCPNCHTLRAEIANLKLKFDDSWSKREGEFAVQYSELQEQYNALFADYSTLKSELEALNQEPAAQPAAEAAEPPRRRSSARSAKD